MAEKSSGLHQRQKNGYRLPVEEFCFLSVILTCLPGFEKSAYFLVCHVLTKSRRGLPPVDLGIFNWSWWMWSLLYPPGYVPTPPCLCALFPFFQAGLRNVSTVWTAPCVDTLISSAMTTRTSSWVLFCCVDRMGFLRKCGRKRVNIGVSLTRVSTLALPFQLCDF